MKTDDTDHVKRTGGCGKLEADVKMHRQTSEAHIELDWEQFSFHSFSFVSYFTHVAVTKPISLKGAL
jgi:hypothetical protein